MFSAVFAALILQQAPPAGAVVWEEPGAPEVAVIATEPAQTPQLPEWALADPFAWERSQCSPLVRRDATLQACQTRVRSDLAANLGDALPPALKPVPLAGGCSPTSGDTGYAVECGPRQRPDRPVATSSERICETRPQRQGSGAVAWTEVCRPASGQEPEEEGLRIKLFGD